jgi:hypothetical protein
VILHLQRPFDPNLDAERPAASFRRTGSIERRLGPYFFLVRLELRADGAADVWSGLDGSREREEGLLFLALDGRLCSRTWELG